jgi:hypothetical protein
MFLLDTNFLIDLHVELRRKDGVEGPAKRFMRTNILLLLTLFVLLDTPGGRDSAR